MEVEGQWMKVAKCHFGSKKGKCLLSGRAFWNFDAMTLEESTVGWMWPCSFWPPYNQVGWKWPSWNVTFQGAESASWMEVAIPNLASQSPQWPCWVKVAILHSCFSECRLTLLDESGHSQCTSQGVQNDLVGWKWPFSSFAPQSAEWPCWVKTVYLVLATILRK